MELVKELLFVLNRQRSLLLLSIRIDHHKFIRSLQMLQMDMDRTSRPSLERTRWKPEMLLSSFETEINAWLSQDRVGTALNGQTEQRLFLWKAALRDIWSFRATHLIKQNQYRKHMLSSRTTENPLTSYGKTTRRRRKRRHPQQLESYRVPEGPRHLVTQWTHLGRYNILLHRQCMEFKY